MHLVRALGFLAALATATPFAGNSAPELDTRDTYIVEGNATDAALWAEPDDTILEPRQVKYRCYSTGQQQLEGVNLYDYHARACQAMGGNYAANQEKVSCQNYWTNQVHLNYAAKNTQGARPQGFDQCTARMTAILANCKRGGRVNSNGWETK